MKALFGLRFWSLCNGFPVAASLLLGSAQAADGPLPAITVQGEATADVVPDTAHLSLGVETQRSTATAATADLAKAAQAMIDTLKAEGIESRDVATTALALTPIYPEEQSHATGTAAPPRMFRAATALRITVTPAERAGTLASHLIDKGANTIQEIDYADSREAARLDDLRAEAMRDALRKAQIYTNALGLHLGKVLEITPESTDGVRPQPMMAMRAAAPAAKAMIPTAPGALTLHVAVSVRWSLEP